MVASSCRTQNSPCQLFMSEKGFARKIWKIERPGNLQQLNMIDDILPPPGSGEISVRVESIGLNFADVFTVLGMYDAAPRDKPVIPGLEFCGIVEAIGDRKIFPKAKVARSQDGSRCGNRSTKICVPPDSNTRSFPIGRLYSTRAN